MTTLRYESMTIDPSLVKAMEESGHDTPITYLDAIAYIFKMRDSGVVQHTQESGHVHTRLSVREMIRLERDRANKNMTYARQFLPTMADKRAAMGLPVQHIAPTESDSTTLPYTLTRYHNGKVIT